MLLSILIIVGIAGYLMIKNYKHSAHHLTQKQYLSGTNPTPSTSISSFTTTPNAMISSEKKINLPENIVTKWIRHTMDIYRVRYGAVVAIDVKNCTPIAIVSKGMDFSAFKAYPAASLAKLVTASAAIELNHIPQYALFYYDTRNASQSIRALTDGYYDGRKRITFSMALAKSNNPVFGKLALYKIGASNLQSYFDRFYFNRSLGPSFIEQSRAYVEKNGVDVAQTGAGLNPDTTISPFHAALIAQAIGNAGNMCVPYNWFDGAKQYTQRIIDPATAKELIDMMRLTITQGTSRRAFFNRRGRYILADISVAGKTGSIHGYDPEGDYEWFVGIAPVNNPEIAVSALVVNGNKWTIKGSYLGAQTFLAYFFPDAVKKLLHEK
ncbi:MAG: penicillin-binding transpeptidase domain-containing protein [bacterium]